MNLQLLHTPRIFKLKSAENLDALSYTWFTEGFTNYYANVFLLRSKLVTFKAYVSNYNKLLEKYYRQDRTKSDLGNILAHNWNAQIHSNTNNFNLSGNVKFRC